VTTFGADMASGMLRRIMKRASMCAAIVLALLPACSGLATSFDYDTAHVFGPIASYAWIEKQDNSIAMRRVRDAVDLELRARGFVETASRPDVQIAAHVGSQERLRVVDWGYTYPQRGYWHGGRDIDVYQYEEGSLVLDVVDPGQGELVWRGTASKAVDRSWTPEERETEVREAVRALLAEFPPKK